MKILKSKETQKIANKNKWKKEIFLRNKFYSHQISHIALKNCFNGFIWNC